MCLFLGDLCCVLTWIHDVVCVPGLKGAALQVMCNVLAVCFARTNVMLCARLKRYSSTRMSCSLSAAWRCSVSWSMQEQKRHLQLQLKITQSSRGREQGVLVIIFCMCLACSHCSEYVNRDASWFLCSHRNYIMWLYHACLCNNACFSDFLCQLIFTNLSFRLTYVVQAHENRIHQHPGGTEQASRYNSKTPGVGSEIAGPSGGTTEKTRGEGSQGGCCRGMIHSKLLILRAQVMFQFFNRIGSNIVDYMYKPQQILHANLCFHLQVYTCILFIRTYLEFIVGSCQFAKSLLLCHN